MRGRVDLRLLQEVREFELRFSCEDCAYFIPLSQRCALEYPNHEHLKRPLQNAAFVVFCKEFELGS